MSKALDTAQLVNGNKALLDAIKEIDGAGSGLDADLVQGVTKDLLGIGGDGYSWVDETDNRAIGTTYTNTYGKPIMICISTQDNSYTEHYYVDGVEIGMANSATSYTTRSPVTIIVPNNSTYSIDVSTLNYWFELK